MAGLLPTSGYHSGGGAAGALLPKEDLQNDLFSPELIFTVVMGTETSNGVGILISMNVVAYKCNRGVKLQPLDGTEKLGALLGKNKRC